MNNKKKETFDKNGKKTIKKRKEETYERDGEKGVRNLQRN